MLGGLPPALAGEHYRLKIDGFDNTKMWSGYNSYEEECYTKGSKLDICHFAHSTESLASPTISMLITSRDKDWQLLDHIKDEANEVITYMDGSVAYIRENIYVGDGRSPGSGVVTESVNKDWQVLNYRSKDETNTIITYMDGSVVRRTLPITVDGGVLPGTEVVVESVKLSLRPMQDELENISQIEVQVGPHEYLWKPDPVLTKKALNFEEP
ncbi:MAG: hypothetical protein OXF67_06520 [Cyanobacteria bacterium MAG CAR4_bin_6]|nr:hypothetical protein [Cyanobacteria bacterium MAG CAR4_bin_6]